LRVDIVSYRVIIIVSYSMHKYYRS
jgi:hypothetical protein